MSPLEQLEQLRFVPRSRPSFASLRQSMTATINSPDLNLVSFVSPPSVHHSLLPETQISKINDAAVRAEPSKSIFTRKSASKQLHSSCQNNDLEESLVASIKSITIVLHAINAYSLLRNSGPSVRELVGRSFNLASLDPGHIKAQLIGCVGQADQSGLSDALGALECFDHTRDVSFAANLKQVENIISYAPTRWQDPPPISGDKNLSLWLSGRRKLLQTTRQAIQSHSEANSGSKAPESQDPFGSHCASKEGWQRELAASDPNPFLDLAFYIKWHALIEGSTMAGHPIGALARRSEPSDRWRRMIPSAREFFTST